MIGCIAYIDFLYKAECNNGGLYIETCMIILIILILLLSVAFLVLLERKLLRGVQLRTRPFNVGWYRVLQTVMDGLKLLNKPSALNNKHSFTFLVLILLLSYVSNIYMLIVVILRRMLSMFLGVIIGNNIYGKMGAYRMVILS